MERDEAIKRLESLLKKVEGYEEASKKLKKATEDLDNLILYYPYKLDAFDKQHMPDFLSEYIGEKPVKPNNAMMVATLVLVPPAYFVKKKKYKKAEANYQKLLPLAEAAYREKYEEERHALEVVDKHERATAIKEKEIEVEKAKKTYEDALDVFKQDNLFDEELKNRDIIEKILGYFKNKRVDTLKEAINLWYDEKRKDEEEARAEAHRKEMRELEEEKVRAAQEAEDYARMQYEEAANAAQYAKKVADAYDSPTWD